MDDVVDGISIHIGGGFMGAVVVPLLKADNGLLVHPSTQSALVFLAYFLKILNNRNNFYFHWYLIHFKF